MEWQGIDMQHDLDLLDYILGGMHSRARHPDGRHKGHGAFCVPVISISYFILL